MNKEEFNGMRKSNRQSGVVSLFIVIFATLLITIVTISFVRIMIQSQQRATTSDLSQSAYDSSQAGIEDAKRALLKYQSVCSDPAKAAECTLIKNTFNNHTSAYCLRSVDDVLGDINVTGSEVKVQQSSGDNASAMDQAYTCIKITLDTDDYRGSLKQDETKIIPLKGVSNFTSITLEWFMKGKDFSGNNVNLLSSPTLSAAWPVNRPSIMRSQLIQFGSAGFKLDDFSKSGYANTLFLYPSSSGLNTSNFSLDSRSGNTNSPRLARCLATMTTQVYSCTNTITLPSPGGGGTARTAYLRLTSLYNKSNYRIRLFNGVTPVKFKEVQPSIDSTGRANDLIRRVDARVEFVNEFPYPEAAVDVDGNFCKNFLVTDNEGDYKDDVNGSCAP